MRVIETVLAGALVVSSGPAMAAGIGAADLTLWGAAPRAVAEIGSPVTVGLTVTSTGPGTAEALVIRVDATDIRLTDASARACHVMPRGSAVCTRERLAAGEQWTLTFTGIARSSKVRLDAIVDAATPDPNTHDNTVRVVPVVGSLAVEPGSVARRLPWNGGPDGTITSDKVPLRLVNDTPHMVSYQASFVPLVAPYVRPGPQWATLDTDAGSVLEFSEEPLSLALTSDGRWPGLHRGLLHFEHDSPFPLRDVPLSLTVAYWDVPAGSEADVYVHALAGARIAGGCTDENFCPDQPLTRGTAAVWLLRAKQGAAYVPPPAKGMFKDVPVDLPEAPFIEEMVRRGASAGCGPDIFCPDQPVGRGDMAVLVLRVLEGPAYVPAAARRAPVGRALAAWRAEAARRSLVDACVPGQPWFCGQTVTRGEAARIIVAAFGIPTF
jgi:hypothetical protein